MPELIPDFLTQSRGWLLLAICLLALLESLVVVGLLIPEVALLVSLTLLAQQQGIDPLLWCVLAAAGAFAGDMISYELGFNAQQRIRHWSYFRRHPRWLADGESFFFRYGVWSIVLGRFIGPLRPLVPAVAGACAMPRRQFYSANGLSAPAWALLYCLPVFWLGEAVQDYLDGSQLVLMLLLASAVALLFSFWLRRR